MERKALCTVSFLLLSFAQSWAQIATIDTRDLKPVTPPLHIGEGTGVGGGNRTDLQLQLSLSDPSNLVVGEPFEYELLVTNRSDHPIMVPRSSGYDGVLDLAQPEQRFQYLQFEFEILVDDGSVGFIHQNLQLHGKESAPDTMLTLQPGEAVRILGSTKFAPRWQKQPPAPANNKRLMAFLIIGTEHLFPVDSDGKRYRSEARQTYSLETDGNLRIAFTERPPAGSTSPAGSPLPH
jgi:hypothetical protein